MASKFGITRRSESWYFAKDLVPRHATVWRIRCLDQNYHTRDRLAPEPYDTENIALESLRQITQQATDCGGNVDSHWAAEGKRLRSVVEGDSSAARAVEDADGDKLPKENGHFIHVASRTFAMKRAMTKHRYVGNFRKEVAVSS